MNPKVLCAVAFVSATLIGITEGMGVFALTPTSLLIGLPFTVTGVTSGTLAALGALKLLAATALALSYTGIAGKDKDHGSGYGYGYDNSYGGGGGGGYDHGYGGSSYNTYSSSSSYSAPATSYSAPAPTYAAPPQPSPTYVPAPAPAPTYAAPTPVYGKPSYKKRSISNELGNLDLYFHIINEVDANSCALRLICELESTKKENLQDDERMILTLFGAKPKEIPVEALKTPSGPYHFAAYLGSSSTQAECGKFYSRCPYNSTQMMTALRTVSEKQPEKQ